MSSDSRLLVGIPVVKAILDAGSFVGAGKALGLTQSGVSRAIQRLGTRLFERNAKVIRLTEAGKRFCEEVIPLMSRLEEVAEEAALVATAIRGRLRVNVDPTFARLVVVPRLAAFMDAYPEQPAARTGDHRAAIERPCLDQADDGGP
jgi:DNA-binding transcriptional LysR family regulator